MTRSLCLLVPIAVTATGCFDSRTPPPPRIVDVVAKACAVDTATAVSALAPDDSLPKDPGPPDPTDPPVLGASCCDSTDGTPCHPMPYPPDVCENVAGGPEAMVLEPMMQVAYSGGSTTQYYDTCDDDPPPDKCSDDQTGYVFQPYATTRWAITIDTDEVTHEVTAELYYIPEGATAVKAANGKELFPGLDYDDPYAIHEREFDTPDGKKYVDAQNDCIPREDGCGFSCGTC